MTGRWAIITDCESDHDDVIHALAALLLQGAYDETLLVYAMSQTLTFRPPVTFEGNNAHSLFWKGIHL